MGTGETCTFLLRRIGPKPTCSTVSDFMKLKVGVTSFGRNTSNDFYLDSSKLKNFISRHHAEIRGEKNEKGELEFFVYDKGLNGTFINDKKMSGPYLLEEGDKITFGHTNGYKLKPGEIAKQPNSEFQFLFMKVYEKEEETGVRTGDIADVSGNTPGSNYNSSPSSVNSCDSKQLPGNRPSTDFCVRDQKSSLQNDQTLGYASSSSHTSPSNTPTHKYSGESPKVTKNSDKSERKITKSESKQNTDTGVSSSQKNSKKTNNIQKDLKTKGSKVSSAMKNSNDFKMEVTNGAVSDSRKTVSFPNHKSGNKDLPPTRGVKQEVPSIQRKMSVSPSKSKQEILISDDSDDDLPSLDGDSSRGSSIKDVFNFSDGSEGSRESKAKSKKSKLKSQIERKRESQITETQEKFRQSKKRKDPPKDSKPPIKKKPRGRPKKVKRSESDDDDDDDDDSEAEEDNLEAGVTWYEEDKCSAPDCKRPKHRRVAWVQCDDCDEWYHTDCVGCRYEHVKDSNIKFSCGCR